MGIKGLSRFLTEQAPRCVRQIEIGSLMGRAIAVDASLSLYQFMIAIRDSENFGNLTNEAGEVTSHISGFLSRVVKLLEGGIKPVYVFEGKPTVLKSGELARRSIRRAEAEEGLAGAIELGDKEDIKKFMGRTVRVTQQHNDDVKELLQLLGMPIVVAPNEAEAQCAHLAKAGLVYATATEDADALTFGTPMLIRHLNFAEQKMRGKSLLSFDLNVLLEDLKLTMPEFIDFCILCGCDYCDRIKGVGPTTAYKLVQQYRSIDKILPHLDAKQLPEIFPYAEAREFFLNPEVLPPSSIKLSWGSPNIEKLKTFLIEKNNFNPNRVEAYLNRLRIAKAKSNQSRLEAFFGPTSVVPKTIKAPKAKAKAASVKRKAPKEEENGKRQRVS